MSDYQTLWNLNPDQREKIRKILTRAFSSSFMEIQDPTRMELHIVSARNGIIVLLSEDCWTAKELAALLNQSPEYCQRVINAHNSKKGDLANE